ncbi:hypothetical protein HDU93_001620 [Gonapodya sp. JEL0774]|nr:hypothetical protein HDU93_001620 [Gonapodya sp. JEL0774]
MNGQLGHSHDHDEGDHSHSHAHSHQRLRIFSNGTGQQSSRLCIIVSLTAFVLGLLSWSWSTSLGNQQESAVSNWETYDDVQKEATLLFKPQDSQIRYSQRKASLSFSSQSIAPEKNYILVFLQQSDTPETVGALFRSRAIHVPHAYVVVFAELDALSADMHRMLDENGVKEVVQAVVPTGWHPNTARLKTFREYMGRKLRSEGTEDEDLTMGLVLVVDPATTFFQSDPFAHPDLKRCRDDGEQCLVLASEENWTVGQEKALTGKSESALSICFQSHPSIAAYLSPLPSTTPNLLVATFPAFLTYLDMIWELLRPGGWSHVCREGDGGAHAIHNYVVHTLLKATGQSSPLDLITFPSHPPVVRVPEPFSGPLVSLAHVMLEDVELTDDGRVVRPAREDLDHGQVGQTVEVVGQYAAHATVRKNAQMWYGVHTV